MSEKTGGSKSYRKDREERKKASLEKKAKVSVALKEETPLSRKEEALPEVESPKESPVSEEAEPMSNDSVKSDVINIEQFDKEKEKQEVELVEKYMQDYKARHEWKEKLRTANIAATENRDEDGDKKFYKLDSSLKKNTAFIKKCKTFSEGQAETLKREMSGLNLTKYIGEVASALVDVKLKMSDLNAMLEFCSLLHQKYVEFASNFLENWQRVLAMKKEDKVNNPSKMRVDLRLYSEMVSIGVFSSKQGLPLLGNLLTVLVFQDKETHANTSIILSFCKHCGEDYAGLTPHTVTRLSTKHGLCLPPPASFLAPEKQKPVKGILAEYSRTMVERLISLHRELVTSERANRRLLLQRGELTQERTERVEKLNLDFEKLRGNTEQLLECMGEAMVELPKVETEKDEEEEQELANEVAPDTLGSLWDDEDTKAFYENLPDLVAIIPSILYKDSKAEAEAEPAKNEEKELEDAEDDIQVDEEPVEEVNLEDEEDLQEAINSSNRMILDAFLSQLPNCVNREMIDSAAAEFCMNHNTKSNRKRLVKALFSVHRTRTDLLSFYSRLVAALQPCMPDVPTQLAALLKQEFRWLVRKKDQINIESKLKVCRFIGEMTKFKMFSKADVLFCIKQLLFDFSHHHIEMACALMESCGPFLYRTPESHRRTKIYLDQMLRKKAAMSLDSRYTTMIENAYYMVAPPDTAQEPKKERPPLHQYIRKLLYIDLNKTNTEKVLRQIRKCDWEAPELADYVVKCIKNVWNVKYFNIRYMASLVAGLVQYQEWVGAEIADGVLEEIRIGMESLNTKHNQRRVAMVKFLSEMYNYRLVDSALIFKVLYSLITFGVVLEQDGASSSLDPPEHTIRLRLVCVILDTCGQFFSSGSSKKKLDYYLMYFQRYYLFKKSCFTEESFPLGLAQLVLDTLALLRPKLEVCKDFEAAASAVLKVEEEFIAVLKEKAPQLLEPGSGKQEVEAGGGLGTISEEQEVEELSQASQSEAANSQSESRSRSVSVVLGEADQGEEEDMDMWERHGSQDGNTGEEVEVEEGEEDMMVPDAPLHQPCPEDDDFLAALDKMVADNIKESSSIKSSVGQMTTPVSSGGKKTWEQLQQESQEPDNQPGGDIKVVVMLRKGGGGKGGGRGISVSQGSSLGEQLAARSEREAVERGRMKQLTLNISERMEEEELTEAIQQLQRGTVTGARQGQRPGAGRHQKGAPDADLIFGSKK